MALSEPLPAHKLEKHMLRECGRVNVKCTSGDSRPVWKTIGLEERGY